MKTHTKTLTNDENRETILKSFLQPKPNTRKATMTFMQKHPLTNLLTIGIVLFISIFMGCERNQHGNDTNDNTGSKSVKVKPKPPQGPTGYLRDQTDCEIVMGIRKKCIINREGVRASSVRNGSPDSPELLFFRPYFVFETYPKQSTNPQYYRIGSGPNRTSIIGWVHTDYADEWNTRSLDRLDRSLFERVPTIYVFKTLENSISWVQGDRTVKPIAETALEYGTFVYFPWPVVEKAKRVINEHEYKFHKLLYLGNLRRGANITPVTVSRAATVPVKQISTDLQKKVSSAVKIMDVYFVMDTTGSMGPVILAVREGAKQIASGIKNRLQSDLKELDFVPEVRYGIAEYRDYGEKRPPYKLYPLVNNIEEFNSVVDNFVADGGGDESEAGFDCLYKTIDDTQWSGVIHKGKGGLSCRVIILLGDHSYHTPDESGDGDSKYKYNARNVVSLANDPKKILRNSEMHRK